MRNIAYYSIGGYFFSVADVSCFLLQRGKRTDVHDQFYIKNSAYFAQSHKLAGLYGDMMVAVIINSTTVIK